VWSEALSWIRMMGPAIWMSAHSRKAWSVAALNVPSRPRVERVAAETVAEVEDALGSTDAAGLDRGLAALGAPGVAEAPPRGEARLVAEEGPKGLSLSSPLWDIRANEH
jgi:hypothetical protein